MFPLESRWELYSEIFWSWIDNIPGMVDIVLIFERLQAIREIAATAMAADTDQPDGKPPPPVGGKIENQFQTRNSSYTGGLKLSSSC